jgi:hypothetical protein
VSQTDTTHPSDAELLATIHAEPLDDLPGIEAHVRECAQCTVRQRALSAEDATIGALLAELDDPSSGTVEPRFLRASRHHWVSRGLRIAGAAATVAVAAAALVVPTSHRWIFGEPDAATTHAAVVSPPAAAPASGIAVPASPNLTVILRHEQAHGNIDITWTTDGDVTFGSRGGTTAYQVASDQVSIDNQRPADGYQISVPRTVQQLRIVVGTRVLLRWPEDSAQHVSAARPDHLRLPLEIGTSHAP